MSASEDSENEASAQDGRPSKTKRKEAMHELQSLGEALVELSRDRLAAVALSDLLREAVVAAKSITKHEARRRQMQYIGRLMRTIDPEPIREKLAEWRGESATAIRELHRVERWRERLLDQPDSLTEFAREYPINDVQELRACIREARRERLAITAAREQNPLAQTQAPRRFRELFQRVKEAMDAARSGRSETEME